MCVFFFSYSVSHLVPVSDVHLGQTPYGVPSWHAHRCLHRPAHSLPKLQRPSPQRYDKGPNKGSQIKFSQIKQSQLTQCIFWHGGYPKCFTQKHWQRLYQSISWPLAMTLSVNNTQDCKREGREKREREGKKNICVHVAVKAQLHLTALLYLSLHPSFAVHLHCLPPLSLSIC